MAEQLIMNSHPHPSDLCTVAVGVGAECKFLKTKDKGGWVGGWVDDMHINRESDTNRGIAISNQLASLHSCRGLHKVLCLATCVYADHLAFL